MAYRLGLHCFTPLIMARPCPPSRILQRPLATRHLSRRRDSNHRPSRLQVPHANIYSLAGEVGLLVAMCTIPAARLINGENYPLEN